MRLLCAFGLVSILLSCSSEAPNLSEPQMLTFAYKPSEIQTVCDSQRKILFSSLDTIATVGPSDATFENSIAKIELAITELNNVMNPITFLKYTSDNEEVRASADQCELAVQQMFVDIFVREDLFRLLQVVKTKKLNLDSDSSFLLDEYISSFQRNGLELSEPERKVFVEKKKRLVALESEFSKNLVEWEDALAVDEGDLDGLSENYRKTLKKDANGKFLVTLDYPHYYPFMENAKSASARKQLEEKFYRRGGVANKDLLDQAIGLRRELSGMLGFPTHAAFVLTKRMAKEPEQVFSFLSRLKDKLIPKGKADLAELERLKLEMTGVNEPIKSYDWRYFENQLKKQKFQVDHELIRQYFPLDVVLKGMFEIYETLLGVTFKVASGAPVWHSSVRLFKVIRDGRVVAHFYMDLFPRDGKYGHAAAFTLVSGYQKPDGSYQGPVSSIVANFTAPTEDSPSLLEHQEVETLFHEFGHIMHQVLTTARYALYSGTAVKNDFVEAPSQMLENWVWHQDSLGKLSGHYQTNEKLPQALLERLIAAKLANSGIRYLRQLSFALIDMTYHTAESFDSTEVYRRLSEQVMLIPIPVNTYPQASFGHLMGGYDSGYYGYLWSEVYAQDMFSRFENEGLLNAKTGRDYRTWILEPGGLKDPFELIRGFLGREPNEEAFLKSIGL